MEKITLKTDLSCQHCINKVEPILKNEDGIKKYQINMSQPYTMVEIDSEGANIDAVIAKFNEAGYRAEKV